MGGQTYTPDDWQDLTSRSAKAATTTHAQTYTSRNIHPDLDPKKITVRESRHSDVNPKSTPIILACDVTGSMQDVLQEMIKTICPVMIKEIFDRKPVTDPHIMFMGIGDAYCDDAPLQVTQFEGNIKMIDQLQQIYLEQGGGGNNSEGYNLAWHFAAYHTSCDAFEKDGRKGFLFTFGDDGPTPDLNRAILDKVYGPREEVLATNEQMLARLAGMYHVFHITLDRRGSFSGGYVDIAATRWNAVLGERHLVLKDYTKMGEVIVSTMQVVAGAEVQSVAKTWSGETGLIVAEALKGMSGSLTPHTSGAVQRL